MAEEWEYDCPKFVNFGESLDDSNCPERYFDEHEESGICLDVPSKPRDARGAVKAVVPFSVLNNVNGAEKAATNAVNKGESSTGAQGRNVLGQCNRPLGAIPNVQHLNAQQSTSKSSMRIAESVVKKMITGELPLKAHPRKKVATLAEMIHNYHYRTPQRCRSRKSEQQRMPYKKLRVTVPRTPRLKTLQRVKERAAAKK